MNESEQLLNRYYKENNFEIVDLNQSKKKKRICYVFFSSNGLYKSRNNVVDVEEMHETNRYEWKSICENKKIIRKASRIIYLRDVFKAFYIKGINEKYNSIDKVIDFLSKETNGMDVVLAGSSAGAYMSLLVGNKLNNTKRIISLGGIVDLEDWKTFSEYLEQNLDKSSYKNISKYLYGNYWIINFYGHGNSGDRHNGATIEFNSNKNELINVGLDFDVHAPRPSRFDIIKLLVCDEAHLKRLHKKMKGKHNLTKKTFSLSNSGFITTFYRRTKSKIIKGLKLK